MTSLNDFKDKCRKTTEKLFFINEEKYLKWKKLKDEQEELGEYYKPLRRSLFHSGKRCPNCKTSLTEEIVKQMPDTEWIIYSCPSCGYEYAG